MLVNDVGVVTFIEFFRNLQINHKAVTIAKFFTIHDALEKVAIFNAGRNRAAIVIESELGRLLGSYIKLFNKESCFFNLLGAFGFIEILVRVLKCLKFFTLDLDKWFFSALLFYLKAFNLFITVENGRAFKDGLVYSSV
jgi:hypothetical protein